MLSSVRFEWNFLDHMAVVHKVGEASQQPRIRCQQAAHAARRAHLQHRFRAIANGVRQIGLEITLAGIEISERISLRLEADESAETFFEHRSVGRRTVGSERVGANIDDCGEALRAQ
jgi:hypothetical protein